MIFVLICDDLLSCQVLLVITLCLLDLVYICLVGYLLKTDYSGWQRNKVYKHVNTIWCCGELSNSDQLYLLL